MGGAAIELTAFTEMHTLQNLLQRRGLTMNSPGVIHKWDEY